MRREPHDEAVERERREGDQIELEHRLDMRLAALERKATVEQIVNDGSNDEADRRAVAIEPPRLCVAKRLDTASIAPASELARIIRER